MPGLNVDAGVNWQSKFCFDDEEPNGKEEQRSLQYGQPDDHLGP